MNVTTKVRYITRVLLYYRIVYSRPAKTFNVHVSCGLILPNIIKQIITRMALGRAHTSPKAADLAKSLLLLKSRVKYIPCCIVLLGPASSYRNLTLPNSKLTLT